MTTTSRGTLDAKNKTRVVQMLASGATEREVALVFGVSKNTVHGIKRRYHVAGEPTTLDMRLDALNAKLNRVLAETIGVGLMRSP